MWALSVPVSWNSPGGEIPSSCRFFVCWLRVRLRLWRRMWGESRSAAAHTVQRARAASSSPVCNLPRARARMAMTAPARSPMLF